MLKVSTIDDSRINTSIDKPFEEQADDLLYYLWTGVHCESANYIYQRLADVTIYTPAEIQVAFYDQMREVAKRIEGGRNFPTSLEITLVPDNGENGEIIMRSIFSGVFGNVVNIVFDRIRQDSDLDLNMAWIQICSEPEKEPTRKKNCKKGG